MEPQCHTQPLWPRQHQCRMQPLGHGSTSVVCSPCDHSGSTSVIRSPCDHSRSTSVIRSPCDHSSSTSVIRSPCDHSSSTSVILSPCDHSGSTSNILSPCGHGSTSVLCSPCDHSSCTPSIIRSSCVVCCSSSVNSSSELRLQHAWCHPDRCGKHWWCNRGRCRPQLGWHSRCLGGPSSIRLELAVFCIIKFTFILRCEVSFDSCCFSTKRFCMRPSLTINPNK